MDDRVKAIIIALIFCNIISTPCGIAFLVRAIRQKLALIKGKEYIPDKVFNGPRSFQKTVYWTDEMSFEHKKIFNISLLGNRNDEVKVRQYGKMTTIGCRSIVPDVIFSVLFFGVSIFFSCKFVISILMC